jgi:CheY-specific phosphatase CheX
MENDIIEILEEIFYEVLEKLAFMFAEPTQKEELSFSKSDNIKASMSFSGDKSGQLSLIVPREMSNELATNILGIEPGDELTEEQAYDSLRELLNVICGQFLTTFAGYEPVFSLSIPDITKIDEKDCRSFSDDENTVGFLVDSYPILIGVKFDK